MTSQNHPPTDRSKIYVPPHRRRAKQRRPPECIVPVQGKSSTPWREWSAYSPEAAIRLKTLYPPLVYTKLHNERKSAQPPPRGPFPLMRLPPELRLKIYGYILHQPTPIELWPHSKDNSQYVSNRRRSQAFQRYRALTPSLGLLRVSRQIHAEAAPVFYGENEFRFSGINAWMVLDAFMNTVRPRHWLLIRHLTLHVPFPGFEHLAVPTYQNQWFRERVCWGGPQQVHFATYLRRMGLKVQRRGWEYRASFRRCIDGLGSLENLQGFRLVLPPTYYINHGEDKIRFGSFHALGGYWERLTSLIASVNAAKEIANTQPLKVEFVLLKLKDKDLEVFEEDRVRRWWRVRYTGQCARMMRKLEEVGWCTEVRYGVHDIWGNYEVIGREECEMVTGPNSVALEKVEEEDY